MLRTIKLKILMFICYNCITVAYSCNYKLLDSNADTFVDRIASNVSTSKKMIGEYIEFLNYDDRDNIEANLKSKNFKALYENNVKSDKASKYKEFSNFLSECKFIYEDYEEIEPLIQAAVYMLVERVVQKIDGYELYDSMYKNLSIKEDIKVNNKIKYANDVGTTAVNKKVKISQNHNYFNNLTNAH